eukprot:TRINITY_DN30257_c0_g1_i3.p1 TRINITY_DN30257_c0_g1~~TRINITY_DN30257_c0_g1_i3.p1  ORF type:complete len:269 (-),score=33.77 TRINITY_DN30257_c0_g1_i3:201-1007(-)
MQRGLVGSEMCIRDRIMGCCYGNDAKDEKVITEILINKDNDIATLSDAERQGSKGVIPNIVKARSSKQKELNKQFWTLNPNGRIEWKRTHVIVAIDCSTAMSGRRWKAITEGFSSLLVYLSKMQEVILSAFTFSDSIFPCITEMSAKEARQTEPQLVFSNGSSRSFEGALNRIINLITKEVTPAHREYLPYVLFASAGLGGFPEEQVRILNEVKREGVGLAFNTCACETEDDRDLVRMAIGLKGEHFQIQDSVALKIAFVKILSNQSP